MTRLQMTRGIAFVALAFSATLTLAADSGFDRKNADQNQFLLRTSDIDAVVAKHDLTVVSRHSSPTGDVWLVKAPAGTSSQLLSGMPAKSGSDNAEAVTLAGLPALTLSGSEVNDLDEELDFTGTLNRPCLNAHMPGAWSGFTGQAATEKIQLREAQMYGGCGEGIVVAVIDTTIDPSHPHLSDAIVPGYDFLNEITYGPGSPNEVELDVRTLAILESSHTAVLSGSHHPVALDTGVVVLGQADLEAEEDLDDLPPYYGHATMTAGLIRMVAPGAQIMPLVAFDDYGTGHPYDIIRAIYHAVDNGADVINMSFSMTEYSEELGLALEYARYNGVIPVGATGNSGLHTYSFPASFTSTVGVASTTWSDQLSNFTNYGVPTGDLTAPGEELVTLYPGGGYAVGWGTSFATPMVAGTAALIRDMHWGHNYNTHKYTRLDLLYGTIYREHLWDWIWSGGRLNAFGAVLYSLGYL